MRLSTSLFILLLFSLFISSCKNKKSTDQTDDSAGWVDGFSDVTGLEGAALMLGDSPKDGFLIVDKISLYRDGQDNILVRHLKGKSYPEMIDINYVDSNALELSPGQVVDVLENIKWRQSDSLLLQVDSLIYTLESPWDTTSNYRFRIPSIYLLKGSDINYPTGIKRNCYFTFALQCNTAPCDTIGTCGGKPPLCTCSFFGEPCAVLFYFACLTLECDKKCKLMGRPTPFGCFCDI